MNKEAQRIAILTHLGWSDLTREGRRGEDGPLQALRGTSPDGREDMVAPNPVTSLDSMHDAEKTIRPPHRVDWSLWDSYIAKFEDDPHATAAQRAEAFLRTIGKWQGGKGGAGE